MTLLEIVVCRERPTSFKYEGKWFVLLRGCIHLTMENSEEVLTNLPIVVPESLVSPNAVPHEIVLAQWNFPGDSDLLESELLLQWRLFDDPHSRLIEYCGRSIFFSTNRFSMMRELIEKNGGPVTFSEMAMAIWGRYVRKTTLIKQVYPLNQFLREEGIPWEVRCSKERMTLNQVLVEADQ